MKPRVIPSAARNPHRKSRGGSSPSLRLGMTLLAAALLVAQAPPEDSPLVKAAKTTAPRKKTTKVITNDDVKKSANKAPATAPKDAANAPAADTKGPLQKHDEQRRARVVAAKRVTDAETKTAELEAELRRLEQAYYEEADLNRRDRVLVPRFEQTKKQLDDAKKELADARDALLKLQ
jgi:membrane-bound lytic murein transglycosylase B